ncbi:hypothetical protein HID58_068980, partial [Brassica napus]
FLISLFFIVTFLAPQVKSRAFYVFGDSLVDNGNNDYLVTTARADNYPYGIDYPTRRPTGRFSNGLNIPDIISEAIGMPSTLPYLSPQLTGENLLVGANFASAGIGILNDTGIQFKLYELGARRVLVTGTGAMGCAPAELAQHSRNGECYGALQTAAALFNPQLVNLIASVNAEIGQDGSGDMLGRSKQRTTPSDKFQLQNRLKVLKCAEECSSVLTEKLSVMKSQWRKFSLL